MWIAIAPWPWHPDWQAPLLDVASAITPNMVWRDHALLLDVQASLQWLGGARGLKHRLHQDLMALGVFGRAAIATSAPGAWLLAMNAPTSPQVWVWRYALTPKRLAQRLHNMPVDGLPAAKRHTDWLHRVGCHTLGELRALDRAELAARTDTTLIKELDQAYGKRLFEYQAIKPAPQFEERLELPRLIEQTSALEPYLKRLLQSLCDWLGDRHLALSRLECRLHHRDRRRAWPPTTLLLAVSTPTNSFLVLWRWLHTRLERAQLRAPVSDIGLLTRTLAPRQDSNLSLFADDPVASESVAQTLDLLRARLGQTGVRQAACVADYRVELANTWLEQDPPNGFNPNPNTPQWAMHCPSWLMAQPKPLAVHREQPHLHGPLQLLQGPYRIETGWWDHGLALRDYFVASDQSKRRYWIYRERDRLAARWFLHGLFG